MAAFINVNRQRKLINYVFIKTFNTALALRGLSVCSREIQRLYTHQVERFLQNINVFKPVFAIELRQVQNVVDLKKERWVNINKQNRRVVLQISRHTYFMSNKVFCCSGTSFGRYGCRKTDFITRIIVVCDA